MITIDDIGNWFAATIAADATLPTLIPGGVWAERVPEFSTAPYGLFTVELEGNVDANSGRYNYPSFALQFAVWTDQNTTADASAIQKRVQYVFKAVPGVSLALRTGESILSLQPYQGTAKFDAKIRNGNDVVVSRFAWHVRCVGRTDQE